MFGGRTASQLKYQCGIAVPHVPFRPQRTFDIRRCSRALLRWGWPQMLGLVERDEAGFTCLCWWAPASDLKTSVDGCAKGSLICPCLSTRYDLAYSAPFPLLARVIIVYIRHCPTSYRIVRVHVHVLSEQLNMKYPLSEVFGVIAESALLAQLRRELRAGAVEPSIFPHQQSTADQRREVVRS